MSEGLIKIMCCQNLHADGSCCGNGIGIYAGSNDTPSRSEITQEEIQFLLQYKREGFFKRLISKLKDML